MKTIMVMFDSLNRHMLPPYGCDWTHAPNFGRLAERCLTFDNSYICSMPCMPARRELHTGRPNFLHRSWGPLEPFDDSMPRLLHENGVSSHLISDHYHYWETGGATYHTRYSTWQFYRGQEGDPWMGQVADPPEIATAGQNALSDSWHRQDRVNRSFMQSESRQPQAKTFAAGCDFIRRNHTEDPWYLQIETFDPHEPFFSQQAYKDLYPGLIADPEAPLLDWPVYGEVKEGPELIEQCLGHYAALLSMCDSNLGKVLDLMDELSLWDDTLLIVWTDHGFLLSEHGCWGKGRMPWYNHLAHTPFFVWDPRCRQSGERRQSLVQPALDLGPTILHFFGLETTPDMRGCDLAETIASDAGVREAAIFGTHGGHLNVTDGRYVYMHTAANPENTPLYNYTLMPTNMREFLSPEALRLAQLSEALPFSKGCPLLRIPVSSSKTGWNQHLFGSRLYDLDSDPGQSSSIDDPEVREVLIGKMRTLMEFYDAPPEQYQRLGI